MIRQISSVEGLQKLDRIQFSNGRQYKTEIEYHIWPPTYNNTLASTLQCAKTAQNTIAAPCQHPLTFQKMQKCSYHCSSFWWHIYSDKEMTQFSFTYVQFCRCLSFMHNQGNQFYPPTYPNPLGWVLEIEVNVFENVNGLSGHKVMWVIDVTFEVFSVLLKGRIKQIVFKGLVIGCISNVRGNLLFFIYWFDMFFFLKLQGAHL